MNGDNISFLLVVQNVEVFDGDVNYLFVKSFCFDKSGHKVILGQTNLNTNNPMKPHFVAIFLALGSTAFAQNKTLGIGTTTLNAHAALHVESPTNNQGFIMPRLSTVQRTAIALGAPDAGLMVYDNVINKPYYWDGASWLPAAGLAFPYLATDASGTASFSITNSATGFASTFLNSGTGGAGQFSISNAGSTANALSLVHAGNGNALNANSTISVNHSGNRMAGDFQITNPSNVLPALNVSHAGSGSTIMASNSGTGVALTASNSDVTNTNLSLHAYHNGLGSVARFQTNLGTNNNPTLYTSTGGLSNAAYFESTNATNSSPVITISHLGSGNAITANAPIQATAFVGDGSGLTNLPQLTLPFNGTSASATTSLDVTNFSNGLAASFVNNGTGSAAQFLITNAGSAQPVVQISSTGTGNAINTNRPIQASQFIGDGSLLTNVPGLTLPFTSTSNTGATSLDITNTNAGSAGYFGITEVTNGSPSLSAYTAGTGYALNVLVNNASNSFPALNINHNGTGNAITANRPIQASQFIGDGSGLTNLPASGWALGGNSGTVAGTNYIGTSDANELVFKTNNVEAMRMYTSGQIGIGDVPVSARLAVGSTTNTIGVHASINTSTGGQNRGLSAYTAGNSAQNYGVYGTGEITGTAAGSIGVYGDVVGTGTQDAFGVMGITNNFLTTSGVAYGIFGSSSGSSTANWAGFFDDGNVHIENKISLGTPGTFGTSGQVLTSQGSGSAPIWSNPTVGANSITNTEIVDNTIQSEDLSTSINITTSGAITAASFTGNGSGLTNLPETGWGLTGITGTGTEFIGTTNDQPVNFRQNNQKAGLIDISTNGNTFFGYHSGLNNTGVTHSTAFGHQALISNGTGTRNTAIGFQAIFSAANGNNNTALGWQALASNTGNNNVGIGHQANGAAAGGSNNTAVGYNALAGNTSGNNTAVGYQALDANTSGTSNTAIGNNADVGSGSLTNATAIGADAVVNDNNTVMLGSPGTYVSVGGSVRQGMLSVSHSGSADPAGIFGVTNASNGDAAISATTLGAGYAGEFSNQNVANANAVVSITNSGSGPSLFASTYVQAGRYVASSTNSSATVDIIQSGTGGAGTFQIANAASATAALLATTNGVGSGLIVNVSNGSNTQPGLEINHNGNSAIGLSINGGTLKYSTATVGTPGLISVKAGVYTITTTGSYTLPGAIAGETCLVYNNSGGPLSGDLSGVANATVRQFVYVGGAWRIVN
jgi:hypothetical protein